MLGLIIITLCRGFRYCVPVLGLIVAKVDGVDLF